MQLAFQVAIRSYRDIRIARRDKERKIKTGYVRLYAPAYLFDFLPCPLPLGDWLRLAFRAFHCLRGEHDT